MVCLLQLRKDPSNEEANKYYLAIEPLKKTYMKARMQYSDKNHQQAVDLLGQVIDVSHLSMFIMLFIS